MGTVVPGTVGRGDSLWNQCLVPLLESLSVKYHWVSGIGPESGGGVVVIGIPGWASGN